MVWTALLAMTLVGSGVQYYLFGRTSPEEEDGDDDDDDPEPASPPKSGKSKKGRK